MPRSKDKIFKLIYIARCNLSKQNVLQNTKKKNGLTALIKQKRDAVWEDAHQVATQQSVLQY